MFPPNTTMKGEYVMKNYVTCVRCRTDIALTGDTLQGDIVQCPECGLEQEVLSLDPFIPDTSPEAEDRAESYYLIQVPERLAESAEHPV